MAHTLSLRKPFHNAIAFTQSNPFLSSIFMGILCALLHYIRISLPGTPVPLVIQPFGTFCAGALLGPWFGLFSQLIYLALLPFTAWSSVGGLSVLWGPTSGYIWGIVTSSFIVGMMVRENRTHTQAALALYIITAIYIYLPGMLILRVWYGSYAHVVPAWSTLLKQAIVPFLFGDLLKAVGAGYVISLIGKKQ